MAAYVVAKVSGQRFEDFVQENLFDVLDMDSASYFLTDAVQAHLVKSYADGGVTEIPYSYIGVRPSGTISATPADVAHLVQMLLNRGTYHSVRVLQPESIRRMETPTTTLAAWQGIRTGPSLGSFAYPAGGFLYHGHQGVVDGFIANYWYLPDDGVGYFYAINAANGFAAHQIDTLLRAYLTRDLQPPDPPAQAMPTAQLQQFTGYYESVSPPVELARLFDQFLGVVQIQLREGKLWAGPLIAGGQEELIPVGERQFRAAEDPVASMVFVEAQGGGWIMQGVGNGLTGSFRSMAAWQIWLRFGLLPLCLALSISAVLYALVWLPLAVLGKSRPLQYLGVRVFSLAASLLGLVVLYMYLNLISAGPGAFARFGRVTAWSVAFWLLSWMFALATVAALVHAIRAWRSRPTRMVQIHSLLVSLANIVILFNMASVGLIGVRTWL